MEGHLFTENGKMGYGGACFPKDVNAYNFHHKHSLTDFMKTYNEKLRNGFTEK